MDTLAESLISAFLSVLVSFWIVLPMQCYNAVLAMGLFTCVCMHLTQTGIVLKWLHSIQAYFRLMLHCLFRKFE